MKVPNRQAVLTAEVDTVGAEDQWNILTEAIRKAVKEVISDCRRRKKKPWMTDETLDMMDEGTLNRPRRNAM